MPADPLTLARDGYAATVISSVGLGAYLVVAIQSIMILSRRHNDKVKTIMLTYAVSMLCLVLAWFTLAAASNEAGLVEIPMHARLGGQCKPVDISRSVLITFIFWAGDGLLVWRTWTIWEGNWMAVSLPILAYVGTLVTGIGSNLACLSINYNGLVRQSSILKFSIPFLALSTSVNVIATGLIVFKLVRQRRRMRAVGLSSSASDEYTGVIGILTESAFAYTATTLVYLPLKLPGPPTVLPLGSIQGAASLLCPALIQLRVAQGIMYGSSTQSEEFSSGGEMQFTSQHATTTVELSHERSSYKDRSSKASVRSSAV